MKKKPFCLRNIKKASLRKAQSFNDKEKFLIFLLLLSLDHHQVEARTKGAK